MTGKPMVIGAAVHSPPGPKRRARVHNARTYGPAWDTH